MGKSCLLLRFAVSKFIVIRTKVQSRQNALMGIEAGVVKNFRFVMLFKRLNDVLLPFRMTLIRKVISVQSE